MADICGHIDGIAHYCQLDQGHKGEHIHTGQHALTVAHIIDNLTHELEEAREHRRILREAMDEIIRGHPTLWGMRMTAEKALAATVATVATRTEQDSLRCEACGNEIVSGLCYSCSAHAAMLRDKQLLRDERGWSESLKKETHRAETAEQQLEMVKEHIVALNERRIEAESDAAIYRDLLTETRKQKQTLLAKLLSLQWSGRWQAPTGEWFSVCPDCGKTKEAGHYHDCHLSKVLAMVEKETSKEETTDNA